ncbi:MAG TPA: dihydrodipicolinate synthase family protein [Puia sp.]|jgi:4-hydroxy-tetrahydrodipicolinate synthase|nr:dihydrodipicolinate synthase family protein [Puia sp.]
MRINWNGVYPAVTTKFTANDTLDLPAFGANLDAQVQAGVTGIIIGGSLGEASTLTIEEKEILVKYSVDRTGLPVLMNIAEGTTREAVRQAELAAAWGARGLMLLPPMRYKSDHRETVAFFKAVAHSTELPILIYNNPVDYKIEVTLEMFDELLELSNVQAVKESTRDITNVTRLINRFGDRLKILTGVDPIATEALIMGAHGWVAGLVCAFPAETVAIYRLVKAGRIEEALEIHRWFLPLLELDIHPKLVQYIKLAEAEAGLGTEYVRAPRLTLVGEERERVLAVIRNGLATRPALPEYLELAV